MAKAFSPKIRQKVTGETPEKEILSVAKKFANLVEKQLKDFVVSIVLFGSCAVDHATKLSDIDVLIIVDDVSHVVDHAATDAYRAVVEGCASKTSPRLHINTLKLTNFWEYSRAGDPVVLNMLRDGVVLFDRNTFKPMQILLEQGRVRPTKESIWMYYARTTKSLQSAQKHVLSACVDLYWSAIDASHAALMSVGELPASPEHVADMLEHSLVKKNLLPKHMPSVMRELYHLHKGITHREIKDVSGEQYDAYYKETLKLVEALRTVVERFPPA